MNTTYSSQPLNKCIACSILTAMSLSVGFARMTAAQELHALGSLPIVVHRTGAVGAWERTIEVSGDLGGTSSVLTENQASTLNPYSGSSQLDPTFKLTLLSSSEAIAGYTKRLSTQLWLHATNAVCLLSSIDPILGEHHEMGRYIEVWSSLNYLQQFYDLHSGRYRYTTINPRAETPVSVCTNTSGQLALVLTPNAQGLLQMTFVGYSAAGYRMSSTSISVPWPEYALEF